MMRAVRALLTHRRLRGGLQSHSHGGGRPPFRDWDSLSDAKVVEQLKPAAEAIRLAEDGVAEHVCVLRARGVTWERIGAGLGMSRQAAWERFSRKR